MVVVVVVEGRENDKEFLWISTKLYPHGKPLIFLSYLDFRFLNSYTNKHTADTFIDRKRAEMVAVQVALEKLRQRDWLLTTENEIFKMENVNHEKRVMELETEVKKLSGQQNLQQRIDHHTKIKARFKYF
ncbi:hypothetical protein CsSME_00033741 [Camellia sinensis var. sinensis]